MASLYFIVEGEPVGKGRARSVTRRSKTRGTYIAHVTPEKTRSYEAAIRSEAARAMENFELMGGPLAMRLEIYMGVPASWSKAKRDAALIGEILPVKKPDVDNVCKAVCDAMNGVVYLDDSQIVDCHISKQYSAVPRVEIRIGTAR